MQKKLAILLNVVLGVLASAEIVSGQISTILGPEIGPKVAAAIMLAGTIYNVYQRVKPQ